VQAVTTGVNQAQLSAILEGVRGTPLHRIVNEQILRAMAKARYSETNVGHFGLVMENFSHFTSPIRLLPGSGDPPHPERTAGLGMKRPNLEKRYREFVGAAAARSSECEVRAVQVERDCEDCYKAEYILGHLGERFEGIVFLGGAARALY
jgi:ribonuclease R